MAAKNCDWPEKPQKEDFSPVRLPDIENAFGLVFFFLAAAIQDFLASQHLLLSSCASLCSEGCKRDSNN